jgi:P-type Cu+ transporter
MASAKTELRVAGLAEPGLPSNVEGLLSAVEGVEYAHVNLGAAKVTINYDDSVTGAEALIAELKRAGFDATQD